MPFRFGIVLGLLLCNSTEAFHFSKPIKECNKVTTPSSFDCFKLSTGRNHKKLLYSTAEKPTSSRWYGGWKPPVKKLSDISKKKKCTVELIADGEKKLFKKDKIESLQHVLTKGILWKLYKDEYPNIEIEKDIGHPVYQPDVIALDSTNNEPIFWGESGRMKVHKARELVERYPDMDIVQIRWGVTLEDYVPEIEKAVRGIKRKQEGKGKGKFTFGAIPNMKVWEYFDEDDGTIQITKDMIDWYHLEE